jgi:hypothetical protein
VFIFYNHNTDRVREVKRHDGAGVFTRVDSLGHFVFKYSDDHGRSWSARRYDIPVRRFRCDRENVYGGDLCFFWNVGKAFIHDGAACVPLHKVGRMGRGFFAQSEGVLLRSANLLTEADPARAAWETLPEGDVGLRTPPGGGPVAEEQSVCVLSDGSLYCVYRTVDGHPAEAYSRDGGRTWTVPRYKTFADGRRMKHPRAANFAWRCGNGRYLYWLHNHGGRFIGDHPDRLDIAYEDRNPVWLSGGIEADSPEGRVILWSEPDIALYDDDPYVRMSYPDLVEEDGRYYLTETQKHVARVHEIPTDLVSGLWTGLEIARGRCGPDACPGPDPLLALPASGQAMPAAVPAPLLPAFRMRDHQASDYRGRDTRQGFAVEMCLTLDTSEAGPVLLDSRTEGGRGLLLSAAPGGAVEILLNDGQTENRWASDPVLKPGQRHHVVVNVDGGPRIISFVVDGRFNDGGDWRPFGWGRFSPFLRHANGGPEWRVAPVLRGRLHELRVHGRCLRTAEAIARARRVGTLGIPAG